MAIMQVIAHEAFAGKHGDTSESVISGRVGQEPCCVRLGQRGKCTPRLSILRAVSTMADLRKGSWIDRGVEALRRRFAVPESFRLVEQASAHACRYCDGVQRLGANANRGANARDQ